MACVQVGGVQYTHAQPLICLVCYSVPLQSLTAVPASVHTVRRGGGRADAEESFSSDAEAGRKVQRRLLSDQSESVGLSHQPML